MKIMTWLVLAGVLILPGIAPAQTNPTVFPALGNENPAELDALTGRCSSADEGHTIECLFITIILNREIRDDGTICRLWGTAGNEVLSRAGAGTWVSESEPSGSCGVFSRIEFSCDPETMFRCEYFEQSTYTVTTGEACEHYAEVQDPGDRYSWRVSDPLELTCDTIEFSYD